MWKSVVWGVLGMLSGVAIALFAGRLTDRGKGEAHAAALPASVTPPAVDTAGIQRQLDELRQAVSAQEAANAARTASPPESSASPPSEPADTLPVVERDPKVLHRKALAEYAQEGADPSWAPETAQTILADLRTIAPNAGFEVRSVNCRTTLCVADLQFPTYAAARQGWSSVMEAPNASRCGFEILLDDQPTDATRPFSTQVVYNCEKVRSGEH